MLEIAWTLNDSYIKATSVALASFSLSFIIYKIVIIPVVRKIKINYVKCLTQPLAQKLHPSPLLGSSMANPTNLHFLTYCRVFLKEQINIYIKVAGGNAPRHSSYHLQNTKTISFLFLVCREGKKWKVGKTEILFTDLVNILESTFTEFVCPEFINCRSSK